MGTLVARSMIFDFPTTVVLATSCYHQLYHCSAASSSRSVRPVFCSLGYYSEYYCTVLASWRVFADLSTTSTHYVRRTYAGVQRKYRRTLSSFFS